MDDGKTFMVHEMQSQLGQLGRDYGFVGQETEPKTAAILAERTDLENKSAYATQKMVALDEQLSEQREVIRRFENVLRDMTKTDDAPYGRSISVDFVTDPEIIAAYESGQSPVALIKTDSGSYLGVIDDDKFYNARGYVTESNSKPGDRVVADDVNVPEEEQEQGTITEFYQLSRGRRGVRVQWDRGFENGYPLIDSPVVLRNLNGRNQQEAHNESLLTQQEYDAIARPFDDSRSFQERQAAPKPQNPSE